MNTSKESRSFEIICIILVVSTVLLAAPASAQYNNRFQGTFDGTEPTYVSPSCATFPNAYTVVGPLTTTITSEYNFRDIGTDYGIDMQIDLYSGSFDPGNPGTNYLLTFTDWDETILTAGVGYNLVVSQDCGGSPVGPWDFVLVGGEDLSGTGGITWNGTFDGTEPIFDSQGCGDANAYTVIGPVSPTVSGSYYYRDISINYSMDMQIDLYMGSFDPLDPVTNFVGYIDDWGTYSLTSGTNYYMVISPLCGHRTDGTWEFVLEGDGDLGAGLAAVNVPTLGSASLAILVVLMGMIGAAVLRWQSR